MQYVCILYCIVYIDTYIFDVGDYVSKNPFLELMGITIFIKAFDMLPFPQYLY